MMTLSSPAFISGASIPAVYTCDGDQISPELQIAGVPEGAKSLVLLMDDPDVPKAVRPSGMFDHWVLFNIPPATNLIAEGTTVGVAGVGTSGKNVYVGPCPPPQYEPSTHRYSFRLYALDSLLELGPGVSKAEVEDAMQGHIVERAELIGTYSRK